MNSTPELAGERRGPRVTTTGPRTLAEARDVVEAESLKRREETNDPRIHLSQSSLAKHRECPQLWFYETDLRLAAQPGLTYPVALTLGSWWHAVRAADALTRGRRLESLKDGGVPESITTTNGGPTFANTATMEEVLEGAADAWARMNGRERGSWMDQRPESLPDSLARMNRQYLARWAEDREHEHPLAVEIAFSRPMGEDSNGDQLVLDGIGDELYWDARRKMVVLRDAKAEKEIAASSSANDMHKSQLQLYAWGLAHVVAEWGLGPIRALSFDRARTAVPAEPKLTTQGNLAKSPSDYMLETYLEWVATKPTWGEEGAYYVSGAKKGQPKFGTYDAPDPKEIERLTSPVWLDRWHERTLAPVNRNVVAAHLRSAYHTARDVETTKLNIERYGETTRNLGRHCDWCRMSELCRTQMVGGPRGEYVLEELGLHQQAPRGR